MVNDGVVLRDNWWIHTQMPTVTVEPAFLSNAREASLIATPGFQQVLAMSLRAGIERYDPQLLQRKAQIVAWNAAHPDRPVRPATAPVAARHQRHRGRPSDWLGTLVRYMLVLTMFAAVVRWPRTAYVMARADLRRARAPSTAWWCAATPNAAGAVPWRCALSRRARAAFRPSPPRLRRAVLSRAGAACPAGRHAGAW